MTAPEFRLGVSSIQASAITQTDGDLTRGGLPVPRMTTTQRDAIVTPATGLQVYNTTTNAYNYYSGAAWVSLGSSGGGAPADATYITQTPSSGLSAEQALSLLATGLMQVTTATGVVSSVTTSAGLAALLSDETGSGALVFANTPTLVTPILGVAAGTSLALTGHIGYGGTAVSATDGLISSENFGNLTTATRGATIQPTATLTGNNANVLGGAIFSASIDQNGFNATASLGARGFTASGNASGASGTVTGVVGALVSANNLGAGTLTNGYAIQMPAPANSGVYTSYAAIGINAPSAPTNKTRILIDTLTIPSGNWIIYSVGTDNSSIGGNLGIGLAAGIAPTNPVSLSGQAARTIWMERHTTAANAGNNLTVQAGGAVVGGTDKNGGALILEPGLSTGIGTSYVDVMRTLTAASTGTGDNSLVAAIHTPSPKILANNTTTSLIDIALPTLTAFDGEIAWGVQVTDGTDVQAFSGIVTFASVNKAAVYTQTVTEDTANEAKAVSAGTLTVTWTLVSGTNKTTIKVNANSSLTPSTGFPKLVYTFINNSAQVPTYL